MDLNDVLYAIGSDRNPAKLTVEPAEAGGYEAVLYDEIHDVCTVIYSEGDARHPTEPRPWGHGRAATEARAKGETVEAACEALVKVIAGGYLQYEVPIMWTSSTTHLRVPPSLVPGTPTITPAAAMQRTKQPDTQEAAG